MKQYRVGIVGACGYVGRELVRWVEELVDLRSETRERILTATDEGFSKAHDASMPRAPKKAGNKKSSTVVPMSTPMM